ncbi:MAG: S41 family peptidase [Bacteroidaceae bacterium]|nr:S41 family peptidase [Bacteroidaceae bacterium]
MKKHLGNIIVLLSLTASLASCYPDETLRFDPNSPRANLNLDTFTGQFKAIWNGINEGYTFWPITDVDWDKRYKEYLPIFEQLDKDYELWQEDDTHDNKDFITPDSISNLYESLTYGLIDGHMTLALRVINNSQYAIGLMPALQIWEDENGHPACINAKDFMSYTERRMNSGMATRVKSYIEESSGKKNHSTYNVCYVINGKYLYYRYPGFVTDDFEENELKPEGSQSGYHKCLKHFRDLLAEGQRDHWLKGVIIDLRNNTGGHCDAFPYSPVGMLLDSDVHNIGSYQGKNGLGHYDLTPSIPFLVCGCAEKDYQGPVVLLTDQNTASMAEIAVHTAEAMPGWTTIGETTYGAIGGWFGNDYFTYLNGEVGYGYSTDLRVSKEANYYITMSHIILRGVDGECHEGIGIKPDIRVNFNSLYNLMPVNPKDTQFDAALRYLDDKD